MEKIRAARFFNLLKQYWNSNPDKTLKDIWLLLIDTDLAQDMGMLSKVGDMVLTEEKAYNKLLKLCQEDNIMDDFLSKYK